MKGRRCVERKSRVRERDARSTIEISYEIVELRDVSLLSYTDVAIIIIVLDNSSLFSSIRHYLQMHNFNASDHDSRL